MKNETEKEQSSASSDIIISSKNIENDKLKILVVDNEYSNKAILINLPTDQRPDLEAKIIEMPTIKDNTKQHIYNILESKNDDNLTHKESSLEEHDTTPVSSTNDSTTNDYNRPQDLNNIVSESNKTKPEKPNRKKIHKYVNIDIPME